MKLGNLLISIMAVTAVIAVLALYGYDVFKRRADWEEVQKAAIRVDSGLKHETLIALRSKVADLDAALTHYVEGGSRRQEENRVISIQRAIESLEWAVEHEKTFEVWDEVWEGSEEFSFYEKRPYLSLQNPNCAESTGKLFLVGAELVRASLTYAQSALIKPDQSSRLRTVDLSSLRTKCISDYEVHTQEKAAAGNARQIQRTDNAASTVAQMPPDASPQTSTISPLAEDPQSLGAIGVADQDGIRITEIIPGGPAEMAGLSVGDVLTTIDGKPVKKITEKSELMTSKNAGSQLVVTYVRGDHLGKATLIVGKSTI